MLTADAFGVLPPISKLTPEQAMYHFLSGYTAQVAGTEGGVKEPQATFSTCFGAPFMPRHPTVYARMLRERMRRHQAHCWLVNTGWSGGPYGSGQRMKLAHTRAMLRAALSGRLDGVAFRRHPAVRPDDARSLPRGAAANSWTRSRPGPMPRPTTARRANWPSASRPISRHSRPMSARRSRRRGDPRRRAA